MTGLLQAKSPELEVKPGENSKLKAIQLEETERCAQSNLYFLKKYGKVRDKIKGIIPWEAWTHLVEYLKLLRQYRFIICLKAKQIGATWCLGGDNLHLAMFLEGANILTLSKGELEASESLDYSRFVHSQLPQFLQLPIGKNQESLISFPDMHSKLRALPSTEDAGVGFGGATRVVMDEFEYHKYDKQNYSEILPPILAGGQLVIQSTADKLKTNTLFKELYIAAKHGDNNFYPIFFPYDVLPERTEEWYDTIDMPASQKECRFPRNEKEALETLKSRAFFDNTAVEAMYADVMTPLEHELSDKYKGLVRIYRLPVIGRQYCLFTDPSDGKEDPHASVMLDARTGEEVAESHGKVPADLVAQIHDELARLYGAFNAYEINALAGGHFDAKIKELDTPNQCHRLKNNNELDKSHYGWFTGKAIKNKALWGLEEAIRLRQIIPHSRESIYEMEQFMQPEGEDPSKPQGGHDDYIDAFGRAWLLRNYAPLGESTGFHSWKRQGGTY
jgi:hypothetical protein